jgi:hypothetical protein
MARKYRGKWVALKADRKTLVAAGETMREALTNAVENGHPHPVITRMPATVRSFVGLQRSR